MCSSWSVGCLREQDKLIRLGATACLRYPSWGCVGPVRLEIGNDSDSVTGVRVTGEQLND